MKQLTLTGMLRRSLIHRRARSISALVAMTVSAGVATALLTLYADLDTKLHKEFRSFGANIVVTGQELGPDTDYKAQTAAGPGSHVAPFAYAVATTDRGTPVVVAGTDFEAARVLNPSWQVTAWPNDPSGMAEAQGVLLGQRAAAFVNNKQQISLTYAGRTYPFSSKVEQLQTGGDEDSRIYLSRREFCALTLTDIPPQGGQGGHCVQPSVIEVQVPGDRATIEAAISRLKAAYPGATVSPVRQLVEGESRIVDRTHALMYGAVILIALTVAVSVLATLSASVLERRRDFALMKALGGSQGTLMGMFLLEAGILALAGVAAGFVVGSAAAWVIGEGNFHTATLPHLSVLPVVLLLNLVIAALASLLPVRVLRRLQPAALLKGE
jgi:putative ABC transport system permease protein